MTERRHPTDAIDDLVSGRLDAAARAEIEAHLATCPDCRGDHERSLWLRERLSQTAGTPLASPDLSGRIARALDAEDARNAGATGISGAWLGARFLRTALAFGIPLLIVAAAVAGWWLRTPTIPQRVAQDYRDFKHEELFLEMLTTDARVLEQFFAHRAIGFETRVLDLAMMQFTLEGGRVHRLARRLSAAFVYRGPSGEYLLCQMYPGTTEELPDGATLREHEGIRFHVYRRGDLTLAFWREGSVICVLASDDLEHDALIQLAFAKAMLAPGDQDTPGPDAS